MKRLIELKLKRNWNEAKAKLKRQFTTPADHELLLSECEMSDKVNPGDQKKGLQAFFRYVTINSG